MSLTNGILDAIVGIPNGIATVYLDLLGGVLLSVTLIVFATICYLINNKE